MDFAEDFTFANLVTWALVEVAVRLWATTITTRIVGSRVAMSGAMVKRSMAVSLGWC